MLFYSDLVSELVCETKVQKPGGSQSIMIRLVIVVVSSFVFDLLTCRRTQRTTYGVLQECASEMPNKWINKFLIAVIDDFLLQLALSLSFLTLAFSCKEKDINVCKMQKILM